jgi:Divergent InlB B-repeat domain
MVSVRLGGAHAGIRACLIGLLLTVTLVIAVGPRPATAQVHEPGTTPEFFGVNAAFLRDYTQPAKAVTLESLATTMDSQGVDWARLTFDQAVEERTEGTFNWFIPDTMVAALARHGVRGAGSFIGTAGWATDPEHYWDCGSRGWPYDIEAWSEWVAASAERYGTNGSFWAEHPELPYLPIETWEIGNESNSGIYWCPAANPEQYASVYSASAAAINEVDPEAEVIVAGLAPRFGWSTATDLDVPAFLSRMTAANPSLRQSIPAVGIHPYPIHQGTSAEALSMVAQFRQAMRGAGMPTTPMIANEIGWYTEGAEGPLKATEEERADKIATVANQLWRTDCAVEGLAPYSWITLEQDTQNSEHWYGLADALTGVPHESGFAYGDQISLATGQAVEPPPQGNLRVCGQKILTVQKNGSGTVDGSYWGINCGQTCSASLEDGTQVLLTATPEPGYAFQGWSGCHGVNGNVCWVVVNADRTVTANFIARRTLTVQKTGSGTVTSNPAGIDCGADCSEEVNDGTQFTLTATPDPGYTFQGWSGCDSVSANTCTVAMNANRAPVANFVARRTLTVQRTGGGSGTVTSSPAGINCGTDCTEQVNDGAQMTLTATAASGHAFRGWTGCDSVNGNNCTVTMGSDRTVSAKFVARRSLTVKKTGSGTVISNPAGIYCGFDCTEVVDDGTQITLYAYPSPRYRFTGWSGCPAPSGSQCTVAMTANRTVTANFKR